jgi:hypothetical protein
MDADFPAAHSMDTHWFAVDQDGRVGYFLSGEAGAVPVDAMQGEPARSMLTRLASALPRSEVLHDRQGRSRPGAATDGMEHLPGSRGGTYPVLMFLKSLDLVAEEIAAGRARQLASTSDYAVQFRQLPAELAQQLHDQNVCLGCFFGFGMFEEALVGIELPSEEERDIDPAAFGFYKYDHTCENWIAGPYGRIGVPANPVHVDQLPPQLRNALKAVRFDVNFAETPHIQPVADHECASWETQWLDLDGKEHPMPGREDEEGDEE